MRNAPSMSLNCNRGIFMSILNGLPKKDTCIMQLRPIAFGVSFNIILQSQSNGSSFNGTWQKSTRLVEMYSISFGKRDTTNQMINCVLRMEK